MSLAVARRKRQTTQTARHLAEYSRKWRLRQVNPEVIDLFWITWRRSKL